MARKPKQRELRPNANPDDVAACYGEYTSLRTDLARMQQRIAVTLGRYEKMGVVPAAIKKAYADAQKDPNEVAALKRKVEEYGRMLGLIEVDDEGQGSIMPGLKVAKPSAAATEKFATAVAKADGYNAGLSGSKVDACPIARWPVGSEGYVAWRDGWEDGHADRVARKPEDAKVVKADTSRKRGKTAAPATASEPEPAADPIGETVGSA